MGILLGFTERLFKLEPYRIPDCSMVFAIEGITPEFSVSVVNKHKVIYTTVPAVGKTRSTVKAQVKFSISLDVQTTILNSRDGPRSYKARK